MVESGNVRQGFLFPKTLLSSVVFVLLTWPAQSADTRAAADYRKDIQPLLKRYCYDCHGDGTSKGGMAFDEFKSESALLENHDLWWNVLKYTRASIMPPEKKPRPTADEQKRLENWIKYGAFGIDPKNPDPGRVTVRRLNRIEYRNTIRDLMGIDFHTEVEFPPDDTGYGFDNIGDVLTLSPMLLEKYLGAARAIVTEAVPTVSRVIPEQMVAGNQFRRTDPSVAKEERRGMRRDPFLTVSYYEPATGEGTLRMEQPGSYHVTLEVGVKGNFDFDPGRCRLVLKIDDREALKKEFGWYDGKTFRFEFDEKWQAGEHRFGFEVTPLTPAREKINSLELRIVSVTVRGPAEEKFWTRPKNYDRFFTRNDPKKPAERRTYAREVLAGFTRRAFRGPVDDHTVERLVNLAESIYSQSGKTIEAGLAHAMVAVLASPRFLFRVEEAEKGTPAGAAVARVNEYALASRLSYFLWSTMPDDTLLGLAEKGDLRKNLGGQVKRMLDDPRSEQLVRNFTGQWLQTRDVDGIAINARAIFARDSGQERQIRQQMEEFRARLGQGNGATNRAGLTNGMFLTRTNIGGLTNLLARGNLAAGTNSLGQTNLAGQRRGLNRGRFAPPPVELDRDLRDAMMRETDLFFSGIMRADRKVTELIDSDYTFLNEKLAKVYGITNIAGPEMRRVSLPPDSPRGGVLTHGSVLVVTSNPDRTSPVKRGLFVLENFLGTPAPPPPANVPALEAAEKDFKDKDHDPTLREALQVHRDKPLCASCHSRMDPIGLAFENFNALGMWREKERGQVIETGGKLITGETFGTVRDLKRILATNHRLDFYRCLTEKLLTYAVGRGMEYYDIETMDRIVQRLDSEDGRFSALLMGVVESAPFQMQRTTATEISSGQEKIASN